jgi:type II secretory pathway predicted ATPase ExeA
MGFIAQELIEIQNQTQTIPNLVSDVNPDKLEAAYGTMFPILVKAVQELTAEVEALKKLLHKD